jgi:myo-inositol catabolism protein IolC
MFVGRATYRRVRPSATMEAWAAAVIVITVGHPGIGRTSVVAPVNSYSNHYESSCRATMPTGIGRGFAARRRVRLRLLCI